MRASAKYPNVWKVTAVTDLPCGDRLYQAYWAYITDVTIIEMMPDM